jgi:hypothetical protein
MGGVKTVADVPRQRSLECSDDAFQPLMRSMSSVCGNRFAPRHILAIFLTSLNLPSFDFLL